MSVFLTVLVAGWIVNILTILFAGWQHVKSGQNILLGELLLVLSISFLPYVTWLLAIMCCVSEYSGTVVIKARKDK
jgi:hypothetical protein